MLKDYNLIELPEDEAREILLQLLSSTNQLPDQIKIKGQSIDLPFYRYFNLVWLECTIHPDAPKIPDLYILWGENHVPLLLEGHGAPVFAVNDKENLKLTAETAPDYLRFFLFAVRGDAGPFILIEERLPSLLERYDIAQYVRPLTLKSQNNAGHFVFEATLLYSNDLFAAVFEVSSDGKVEMVDDKALMKDLSSNALPNIPELLSLVNVQTYFSALNEALRARKSTLYIMVELLLERSLATLKTNRLIDHFNTSGDAAAPLDKFAKLVVEAFPIVAIETNIPFVEEIIGQIILDRAKPSKQFEVFLAKVDVNNHNDIGFQLDSRGTGLMLVPLQVYRAIINLSRIAHDIAYRDIGAIIACESTNHLPESLRSQIDIKFKLPDIDETIFGKLFNRIFNFSLPLDWKNKGIHWLKYLRHNDFEHPRRMQLSAEEAFNYIHGQVLDRLNAVNPTYSLGLKQLHGLGEARQFAEDLIADIHAAIKGQIPWTQVDRGALLVGPPGTGKTTLARAIAKDCGVKFIEASATGWQASGEHLGHHIAAIRKTFSEARSYAPSILFIDEIDSLGNRQTFSDQRGSQYLTEVVNAVLEQLQGMDPTAPVFVIAATNHEDKVDPALRRSGRLDRVIYVPRPNSESLQQIYKHYLTNLPSEMAQDGDIDTNGLGRLSVGLTGADVERIVRGAARRARKVKRPLSQHDLIAEITHKPRSSDGSPRLSPEEIECTAYHEAGHALAIYLSKAGADDIGYVTIVPRDDGKLGFVAQLPDERVSLTRKDCVEKLEIYLAGRAAEEYIYGQDNVSGGATNDLQSATKFVILMVTQLGMAGNQKLFWSPAPTAEHINLAEKILAEAYDRILQKLKDNETKLKALARHLIERQELTGDEVRQLLSRIQQ